MDTTMSDAFAKAGYQSPEPPGPRQRLQDLMAAAIITHGGLSDPACDGFIKRLLDEKDAALVWAFFEEVRMPVVRRLFGIVLHHIRQQNRALRTPQPEAIIPPGSSHSGHATPENGADPGSSPGRRATPRVSAGPPTKPTPPTVILPSPKNSVPAASASPPRTPTLAVGEVASRHSWLDRFIVNGRPIGDLRPAEALTAKELRHRDAVFINLLLSGVPHSTKQRIREFIKPDEADEIWLRAQQEAAA